MGHMMEQDEAQKNLASRLIGKTNINEMGRDILKEYN